MSLDNLADLFAQYDPSAYVEDHERANPYTAVIRFNTLNRKFDEY